MICILCGNSNPNNPLHPTDTLLELVRSRACSGPIVWPAIMAWDQPMVCACRMCFHQLRRVKPRRQDKQPLPLDAAVLQTVVPGTMRQQDSRTRERICSALRMPGNAYSRIFEALGSLLHVEGKKIMTLEEGGEKEEEEVTAATTTSSLPIMTTAAMTKKRMEVWWKFNLQTECFSHKAIARHVRRCGL